MAIADAFIRRDQPDRNEDANHLLCLGSIPLTGVGPTDPPSVGGPTSAGPRLPIDTLTERTEMTAAIKAAFRGENPFPGIPRLCGQ